MLQVQGQRGAKVAVIVKVTMLTIRKVQLMALDLDIFKGQIAKESRSLSQRSGSDPSIDTAGHSGDLCCKLRIQKSNCARLDSGPLTSASLNMKRLKIANP